MPFSRERASLDAALAIVGLLVWAIHWWLAGRLVARPESGAEERRAAIRKLFLYATLAVAAAGVTLAGMGVLSDLTRALIGQLSPAQLVAGDLIDPLARVLLFAGIWSYYNHIAATDRAIEPERGAGATLRRWQTYSLCLLGLR